jgi:hypothetical protein
MSYLDIFIIGWNLNAMMFVANFLLAVTIINSDDQEEVYKQNKTLSELKNEFDKFYPNRAVETIFSYAVPFMAFYRVAWRFIEMRMFFSKNEGRKMYDFIVYKYQSDIDRAKRD